MRALLMVVAASFRLTAGLIRADDLYLVPDPIGGQVYSAAVATRFYPLFDHFFTVNLEFDLVAGNIGSGFFLISKFLITGLIFSIWHLGLPLFEIKIELILAAGCCKQIISELQYSYIVSESREKEVERFKVQGSGFSPAAGLEINQSNRSRNCKKANVEYRIMNIECRSKVFCLFYKKRLSEPTPPKRLRRPRAKPPFDILRFDIRYSAVRF